MNVLTVFSGRRANIEILIKYLKKALELKFIDEVHFWNNTRTIEDEDYIKSITNLKRTSSTGDGRYIFINPVIIDNCFELFIKAYNDIHIKIINTEMEYEILLGGWSNWRSVIRINGVDVCDLVRYGVGDFDNENSFKILVLDSFLHVYKNNELLLSTDVDTNFEIHKIF